MYYTVIEQCWKIARDNNIKLHQSFKFLAKEKRLKLRFAHHPKKKKEARHALKKLRSFGKKLIEQLKKQLNESQNIHYEEKFSLFTKVLTQQKKTIKIKFIVYTNQMYTARQKVKNIRIMSLDVRHLLC